MGVFNQVITVTNDSPVDVYAMVGPNKDWLMADLASTIASTILLQLVPVVGEVKDAETVAEIASIWKGVVTIGEMGVAATKTLATLFQSAQVVKQLAAGAAAMELVAKTLNNLGFVRLAPGEVKNVYEEQLSSHPWQILNPSEWAEQFGASTHFITFVSPVSSYEYNYEQMMADVGEVVAYVDATISAPPVPLPPSPEQDRAFLCLGTCGGATDMEWRCGSETCPKHREQLVPRPVSYLCRQCKGSKEDEAWLALASRSPGPCKTCSAPLEAFVTPQSDEFKAISVIATSQLPAVVPATFIPDGTQPPAPGVLRAPASPAHWEWAGRQMDWTEVSINGGGNCATVYPNDEVSISLKYHAHWQRNSADYCPGCIVQLYYGMAGVFSQGVVESGISNHRGSSSTTFCAPLQPGVYYITQAISLQYHYVDQPCPNTYKNGIAAIRVVPRATGPQPAAPPMLAAGADGPAPARPRSRNPITWMSRMFRATRGTTTPVEPWRVTLTDVSSGSTTMLFDDVVTVPRAPPTPRTMRELRNAQVDEILDRFMAHANRPLPNVPARSHVSMEQLRVAYTNELVRFYQETGAYAPRSVAEGRAFRQRVLEEARDVRTGSPILVQAFLEGLSVAPRVLLMLD